MSSAKSARACSDVRYLSRLKSEKDALPNGSDVP